MPRRALLQSLVSFSDGVPLAYYRNAAPVYDFSVSATSGFRDKLIAFVQDLKGRTSAYGSMTRIVTAGAYVNKPGRHGEGRAFDLDGVEWDSGVQIAPLQHEHESTKDATTRRHYIALDAVARRHCRCVPAFSSACCPPLLCPPIRSSCHNIASAARVPAAATTSSSTQGVPQ
jgi:hypothetical protein